MTMYILISIGFVGAAAFLSLKPRHKVFLSLFVMTACFNAVPRWIYGIDIWDVGAVMLMISAAHMALMKPKSAPIRAPYLQMLKIFTVWCVLSLLWAILICGYPLLDTLKASRQIIIGYLSVFVFLRLWRVDPGAFEFIWKAIYWLTYCFLIVCVVQYLSGKEILSMTSGEYEGLVRRIPFFLPLCLAYLWVVTARLLGGLAVKRHEVLYLLMTLFVTAMTYTRGIYFTVLTIFLFLVLILARHGRIRLKSLVAFSAISIVAITTVAAFGSLDKVITRAMSGVDIILSTTWDQTSSQHKADDTFSGRLALTRERLELVIHKNVLFGYSFIHEKNLPAALKNKLQTMHGSLMYTEEYKRMYARGHPYVKALHSADIGWANIVLDTGVVGLALFIAFVVSITVNFFSKITPIKDDNHFVCLGLFLQVIALVLLMFNGAPYTYYVQIPAFMIAGYAFCRSEELASSARKHDAE